MTEQVTAYIGLGSNLGDRAGSIRKALARLGDSGRVEVTRVSDLKETSPLGEMAQPKYLNGVAEVRTALTPDELLQALKATEAALGRGPHGKWEPRPIDLDLLLFGGQVIDTNELVVPHPQMHLRTFVLHGLSRIDPQIVHPLLGETVGELARRLGGGDFVIRPEAPQLVSVAGIIGAGKTTLARKLADMLAGELLQEPYDTNPFLPEVYAGKRELALDSQLYFLVNRARQIGRDLLRPGQVFVTDYVFEKEPIYARLLLDVEQLGLYESIYQPFAQRVTTPALVVYLEDSPRSCLERIHQRNRPYEQRITLEFLEELDGQYRRLFAGWKACPVIRIPVSTLSGYDEAVLEHVVRQVKAYVAWNDRSGGGTREVCSTDVRSDNDR
jgi:2-amino-4-hydroxy-6-hydroxymethyldihydropteridine diphosphokinase